MRVAHVMAGAPHGGAEGFFERLVPALARAGEEVWAAIRRDPARAARMAARGLAPAELAFGGPLDLLTRPRLRKALRGFGPRVVVAWMNRAARHAPTGGWTLVGRMGGFYDLRYYRNCAHLVGNTRGVVAWVVDQGFPAARAHYVPNFADDFAATPAAALGLPRPLILGLGRLHRNKAFDVLIRALPRLPDATLALAGDGPERAALERLADDAGVRRRVAFLGWRQDAGALLKAADVFVCPSRHEPLGNVVLEAWSAACPVVAAASQGPTELIHDGADGLLVPVDDADALAACIGRVLQDPAQATRLASAGRARFQAEFTEAAVVAAWRAFHARVAA
jgi:glycosyltransferase involved in cell wall biosynthesis